MRTILNMQETGSRRCPTILPAWMPAVLLSVILACVSGSAAAQLCNASSTAVNFNTYDPFSSTVNDTAGTVTVTCTATVAIGVVYTLKLDGGTGGAVATRRMTQGSSQLFYQLYTTTGRSVIFGDGTGGSTYVTDGYLLGIIAPVVKTYSVFGRITARQNVAAGPYNDAVTILLSF